MSLSPAHRFELLSIAYASIEAAVTRGELAPFDVVSPEAPLNRPGASFVTLRIGEDLRGCCGSVEAARSLSEDVWNNAWASAFADPRFPPLTDRELRDTNIHISVLSAPEPLFVESEAELLAIVRPGIDGLILQAGVRRSTFLPAVWEQLPAPADFVRHLKLKAGWPPDVWPADLRVWRYTTESF